MLPEPICNVIRFVRRAIVGPPVNRTDELRAVTNNVQREAARVRDAATEIARTPDPVATLAARMRRTYASRHRGH